MKSTPTILALSLLLTACSLRNAKHEQQIVGTWTGEAVAYGKMTFSPDGGFSFVDSITTNISGGSWLVKDGDLIVKITNAPFVLGRSLSGPETRSKIVSIDANKFVYISGGKTVILSRR